ncbi:hypothetical protein GOBAR_AA26860 [Gossypium barbadense]|uniref:FBD domain-containing protein n=1 Tax=Gossypium barbadense TaxID=3634 RepID=A0A2P5WRV7_GOSBA|nr:hypothetical protein GOBAR_AA26860 [Gossypium barbadense]
MMNLKGSQNLIKTPDFTTASNFEVLILEGCTKLVDVHPSIEVLKRLKLLNLRDCKSLRSLPTKIRMESLETLILSGCSSLVRFPEIDGIMECLKTLDLSGCYRVENLLENLQQAKFLEELDLNETAITEPPSFICNPRQKDESHSSDVAFVVSIPASIIRLSKLYSIRLSDCKMLKSLPELPTSIEDVWIDGCSSLEAVASPSKVCNLVDSTFIRAINCFKLAENINALTLLKKFLKAFANSRKMFDIIMPGSEIPEWFSQQTRMTNISVVEHISIVEILNKPAVMDLFLEVEILDGLIGEAGCWVKDLTSP